MISNAKSFNVKTSQIFSDAEKVRKLVSNFMTERNPAYRIPGYQAVATPVPEGLEKRSDKRKSASKGEFNEDIKEEHLPSESRSGRRSIRNAPQTPTIENDARRASSTPAVQDAEGAGESFEGNTFQQAQDKIVTEMLNLKDKEYGHTVLLHMPLIDVLVNIWSQRISYTFHHAPSRTTTESSSIQSH